MNGGTINGMMKNAKQEESKAMSSMLFPCATIEFGKIMRQWTKVSYGTRIFYVTLKRMSFIWDMQISSTTGTDTMPPSKSITKSSK